MSRGLVVGKFMPLHRGHQLLIESALSEVDDLTVVIYDTQIWDLRYANYSFNNLMPIEKRMKWVADLYPQIENIISRQEILPDVPYTDRDDPGYAQDYANDLAFLGQFDYVFSSEDYGEPFANALGATHVEVDAARKLVPISGTAIRENLYENRGYIDPLVYRSLIQKVVFVGTESTGKSSLAEALAKSYKTKWVHEYGRELWEAQGGTGSFHDLLKIGETQYRREQAAALHSRDYLFCDTNAWTTLQWCLMYHGTADARLYDLVNRTKNEYLWILCDNDFPWVDDGTRELKEKSVDFHQQNIKGLAKMNIYPFVVTGSIDERIRRVRDILDKSAKMLK